MSTSQSYQRQKVERLFTLAFLFALFTFLLFNATPAQAATPMISAGGGHTCAISDIGTVQCWGTNMAGLGDGINTSSTTPVAVTGISDAIAVSVSPPATLDTGFAKDSHSCAVLRRGSVKCWGNNTSSQIGVDSTSTFIREERRAGYWANINYSLTPVTVSDITDAVAVGTTRHASCAVLTSGKVKCWGGIAGYTSFYPREITGLNNVVSIAGGEDHICALIRTGEIYCLGYNDYGQLGNGNTTNSNVPVAVQGIQNAVNISAGGYLLGNCAVLQTGKVQCWGKYSPTETIQKNSTPITVSDINNATDITIGSAHACIILKNKTVQCWGRNYNSELGNISRENSDAPVVVDGVNDAISIASGYSHVCALLKTGNIKCWGSNDSLQRGNNVISSHYSSAIPVEVSNIASATSISLYSDIACSVLRTGIIECWGVEVVDGIYKKIALTPIGDISNAESIYLGYSMSCATLKTKEIKCWDGYFSDGYNKKTTLINGINNETISSVSIGYSVSCAVFQSGVIKCWGKDEGGQFGGEPIIDSTTSITVKGIDNALSVYIGYKMSCAVLKTGEIKCWGQNDSGQLGDGTTTNSFIPVIVKGINNALSVSFGENSVCATLQNGEVKCWGNNNAGQLGDANATIANSATPVTIKGISDAISVIMGSGGLTCATLRSSGVRCWSVLQNVNTILNSIPPELGISSFCKIFDGGKVQCWGNNDYGQLGNGKTDGVSSNTPVTVIGINNAIAISGNGRRNCALLSTGSIQCWGDDTNGALGAGELSYLAPSTVMGVGGVGYLNLFAFSQNVDKVFTWAENRLPQFKPSGVSQSMLGYRYRGYQDRYYLAVNEGGTPHVYYFDNTSMDSLMDVGLLSDFLNLVGN